jgi:hypothetical protein
MITMKIKMNAVKTARTMERTDVKIRKNGVERWQRRVKMMNAREEVK